MWGKVFTEQIRLELRLTGGQIGQMDSLKMNEYDQKMIVLENVNKASMIIVQKVRMCQELWMV